MSFVADALSANEYFIRLDNMVHSSTNSAFFAPLHDARTNRRPAVGRTINYVSGWLRYTPRSM